MSVPPETGWLNLLVQSLQWGQLALLRVLDGLGLADTLYGQPAWPWASRLSGENLLIDLGQARQLALTLLSLCIAVVLLLLACFRRRPRGYLLALVALVLFIAPWPDARVLLVPATPASFHVAPAAFSASVIAQGQRVYAQQCLACHGADGRGQGELAARQPVWPPNLTGPLLWRRADGDVFWRILHGVHDRHGVQTMPAFGDQLAPGDVWALIDFMKAQGAGQTLRAAGYWAQPIQLPNASVRCEGRAPRTLASLRGQRVRIVAAGTEAAARLLEDPRLITVLLKPGAGPGAGARVEAADCVIDSPEAWQAFSLIAGTEVLAGTQLLADRDGWLRARGEPGKSAWSDDDLLCRTEAGPRDAARPASADGMGALIARMDADPVRFVKGGFVH